MFELQCEMGQCHVNFEAGKSKTVPASDFLYQMTTIAFFKGK